MRDIKDFLHLYLGCECVTIAPDGIEHQLTEKINCYWIERSKRDGTVLKPILRPLSDMTEEEQDKISEICELMSAYHFLEAIRNKSNFFIQLNDSFEVTHYLLSCGFDLFNLIPEGLAIDKTKQPTP